MTAITLGNDIVHYEKLGRGRPVILLHSWVGCWRYWVPTMTQLHTQYSVYALDLFGFGDSTKNPERYTVEQQVAMLESFMDELAITKAALVGHGLGAVVAAYFALRHQTARVPRLVLVNAPLFDTKDLARRTPPGQRLYLGGEGPHELGATHMRPPKALLDVLNAAAAATPAEPTLPSASGAMRAALLQAAEARARAESQRATAEVTAVPTDGAGPPSNPLLNTLATATTEALVARCFRRNEPEHDKLLAASANNDTRALRASVVDFDAGRMLDVVRVLQMPTLIVHGGDDPLLPLPNEAVWSYVTGEKDDTVAVIPMAGTRHFPMLEHDRFTRLVSDFLESADVGRLALKERWRRRTR